MANAQTESAEAAGHGSHLVPLWKYFAVFVALLALTGLTVGAAFVNLGPFSNVAALAIAMLKAALVVLYFMHVRYSARLIPLVVVAGLFWLVHLLGGSLADYFTRGLLDVPGK
ncbi:MAG TPA: cytochrome C oxidase subunit IV family protein [Polyangiaceae bacterium]|jgi:cytochrome c oxidase subunit 4|nr:cytochrome C oxidase subunit IV family protein [Polyangiaceae bacterium]